MSHAVAKRSEMANLLNNFITKIVDSIFWTDQSVLIRGHFRGLRMSIAEIGGYFSIARWHFTMVLFVEWYNRP